MGIILRMLALGAATLWLRRWFESDNATEANKAFLKDIHWDRIRACGQGAVTLIEELLKAPIEVRNYDNFKEQVLKLDWCKRQLLGLSKDVRNAIDVDERVSKHLEKRMQCTVMEYAILLGSIEEGSPTEQLAGLYMSLYLIGRLDRTLNIDASVKMIEKLDEMHKWRRQPLDAEIRRIFKELASEKAGLLAERLAAHPSVSAHNVDTDFIVHALMRYAIPDLDFRGVFEEMVGRVSAQETQEAA